VKEVVAITNQNWEEFSRPASAGGPGEPLLITTKKGTTNNDQLAKAIKGEEGNRGIKTRQTPTKNRKRKKRCRQLGTKSTDPSKRLQRCPSTVSCETDQKKT